MMSQSQYSLTWEAHVRNVCDGLSNLQQNGEFVDMTLAADGHMVKVHQVVLALASPYFKDLITSAQCPHPVIFLSRITHPTLSALLEYIYTGEVLVSLEHLNDLVEAAKELHIKGLKDMRVHSSLTDTSKELAMRTPEEDMLEQSQSMFQVSNVEGSFDDQRQQEISGTEDMMQFDHDSEQLGQHVSDHGEQLIHDDPDIEEIQDIHTGLTNPESTDNSIILEMPGGNELEPMIAEDEMQDPNTNLSFDTEDKQPSSSSALQYTVSNQGSLQMILNRFVYYLKHTNRDKSRQWRCVDYLSHSSKSKCPAIVFTKDDVVVQRIAAHTHPFHDKKILKKLKGGVVFSAFRDAEKEGDIKKKKSIDESIIE